MVMEQGLLAKTLVSQETESKFFIIYKENRGEKVPFSMSQRPLGRVFPGIGVQPLFKCPLADQMDIYRVHMGDGQVHSVDLSAVVL